MHRQTMFIAVILVVAVKAYRLNTEVDSNEVDGVNYISTQTSGSGHGELEIRISYNGIKAIETQIPGHGEKDLFYRQVSNGKRLIQSVYQDAGKLIDCDIERDEEDLSKFTDRFLSTASPSGVMNSNVTMHVLDGELDDIYKPLVNFDALKTECRTLHVQLKKLKKAKLEKKRNTELSSTNGVFDEEFLEGRGKSRTKRAMFIYPGTNWCGDGNVAAGFTDLGDNIATDKCCRKHDHCPYTIEGFTAKYNMFNYRFHTLSHCGCDDGFRSCLKGRDNSVADMVGSIYFNVVGTKCFTFRAEKVCETRSWWGRCQKYKKQYKAIVQEPLVY